MPVTAQCYTFTRLPASPHYLHGYLVVCTGTERRELRGCLSQHLWTGCASELLMLVLPTGILSKQQREINWNRNYCLSLLPLKQDTLAKGKAYCCSFHSFLELRVSHMWFPVGLSWWDPDLLSTVKVARAGVFQARPRVWDWLMLTGWLLWSSKPFLNMPVVLLTISLL